MNPRERRTAASEAKFEPSHIGVPRGLLPDGFEAVVLPIRSGYALHPEEALAVSGAVQRRRDEFATGRACIHQALVSLGHPDCPIPVGRGKVPHWPEGIAGSVSHSSTLAVAVVTYRDVARAIGIDVEPAVPLEQHLWPLLAAPGEAPSPGAHWLAESLRMAGHSSRVARVAP